MKIRQFYIRWFAPLPDIEKGFTVKQLLQAFRYCPSYHFINAIRISYKSCFWGYWVFFAFSFTDYYGADILYTFALLFMMIYGSMCYWIIRRAATYASWLAEFGGKKEFREMRAHVVRVSKFYDELTTDQRQAVDEGILIVGGYQFCAEMLLPDQKGISSE